jgi:hypothetical protein
MKNGPLLGSGPRGRNLECLEDNRPAAAEQESHTVAAVSGWALPPADAAVFVFASWARALTGAKPENKLKIFAEMACDARLYADAHRQQVIDDLWLVAEEIGLRALVGDTYVQTALATAFDRGAA